MKTKIWRLTLVAIATTAMLGCNAATSEESEVKENLSVAQGENLRGIAVLTPTEGNQVKGIAKFVQTGQQVTITVTLQGLDPNSVHAWHIHEYGDISGSDGKATGGHYNPSGHDHGLPPTAERHAGDLGNLKTDANGKVNKEIKVDNITVSGDKNPIIGRGLIVHAKSDDGGQPTGNAGARIAQAVIGIDAEP